MNKNSQKKHQKCFYGGRSPQEWDTRDRSQILSSENIEEAVKTVNRKMLKPAVSDSNYTIPSEIINSSKLTDTHSLIPLDQRISGEVLEGATLRRVSVSSKETNEYLSLKSVLRRSEVPGIKSS